MERVIITGLGPVSSLGIGKERFWHSLCSGSSAAGAIVGFRFDEHIDDRRFRRIAPLSQYALVAARHALADAGLKSLDADSTAVIMGLTHGALNYTQQFHGALAEEGPGSVSPLLFSDSVLNAPAGNVSIYLAVRGPVHTLVGGAEAGIKAMALAHRLLSEGTVERAVVISAEELNELSLHCYARLGSGPLGEGAAALVLEREGKGSSPPYCSLVSTASLCNPSNPGGTAAAAVKRCLERVSLDERSLDLIVADNESSSELERVRAATASIVPMTGNAFALSTLWHVLFSALVVREGAAPRATLAGPVTPPASPRRVLVCSRDGQGSAAALLLERRCRI